MTLVLCRYSVVQSCWEESPEDRPNFSELVSKFSSCLSSMADYFDFVVSNPAVVPEDSATACYSMSPIDETPEEVASWNLIPISYTMKL